MIQKKRLSDMAVQNARSRENSVQSPIVSVARSDLANAVQGRYSEELPTAVTGSIELVDEMSTSGVFSPNMIQEDCNALNAENPHGLGISSEPSPSMQSSILRPTAVKHSIKAPANTMPLTMFNLVIALRPKQKGKTSHDIDAIYHQVGTECCCTLFFTLLSFTYCHGHSCKAYSRS
jgi:hypothetical protein